jgi:hypothetical protein
MCPSIKKFIVHFETRHRRQSSLPTGFCWVGQRGRFCINFWQRWNEHLGSSDAAVRRLSEAVMVLEQEYRRFLRFGATKQEFDRAKANILNAYKRVLEGANTRESSYLVSVLSGCIKGKSVFSTPSVDYDIVVNALDIMTPESVDTKWMSQHYFGLHKEFER